MSARPMQKKNITNAKRFKELKNRIADQMRYSSQDIEENNNRHVAMGLFLELDWVIQLVDAMTQDNPAALNKYVVGDQTPETEDEEAEADLVEA